VQNNPNKLRTKLRDGQLAVGAVMYSWSPAVIELAGYAGLDFMRLDNEHAWRQDESAEHMMRAAAIGDIVALHRVDRDNPYLIRKALEIGAGGIIVPDVHSLEHAKAIVQAAKFPPRGTRGIGTQCFSAKWGTVDIAKWVESSDLEPMIGVMIESVKAVECVDDILAVDGVDFALFGPADYAMSLGLRCPDKNHHSVQDALARTVAAARKVGKYVMFGVGADPDEIARYVEMGVTMLELPADMAVLRAGWGNACEAIRQREFGGRR